MSHIPGLSRRESILSIQAKKELGHKISMVTCYDAAFAQIIDETPIDMVLVGDSVGNVMLGQASTLTVTLEDMIHHAKAVTRGIKRAFVVVDMPFMTYQVSVKKALTHAGKLVSKGGAQAVKMEGGASIVAQVKAVVDAGIPVMGHLGFTPQSLHALGGYKVQGLEPAAKERLLADALLLQEAGVFSIVLEMIPSELSAAITSSLRIPTIGVGAGIGCDGQVLVLHDLLGFKSKFKPRFVKRYADLNQIVSQALREYDNDVKCGVFPSSDHSFPGPDEATVH